MTKNAIAETIIALTKMEEEYRSPVRCIATTRVRILLNLTLVHCKCAVGAYSGAFYLLEELSLYRIFQETIHKVYGL